MRRINKFLFLLLMMAASAFTVPAEASCIYNKTDGKIEIWLEGTNDSALSVSSKHTLNKNNNKCFQNEGGKYTAQSGSSTCDANIGAHDWVKVYGPRNALRCTLNDTRMTADELKAERDREKNNQWVQVPGAAIDVGVGKDGSVFVVGISENPLFRFNYDRRNWDKIEAAGTGLSRVDVDNDGNPWWVTQDHKIFTMDMETGVKTQLPGEARDIGVGAAQAIHAGVYIVSNQAAPGGFVIMRLNLSRNGWRAMGGNGTHIDVAQTGKGLPVITNNNDDIFSSWVPSDDPHKVGWKFIGRKGHDIAFGDERGFRVAYVGLNGSPMAKNSNTGNISQDSQWVRLAGRPLSISISNPTIDVPGLWMTDINNNIFYWRTH